MINVNKARVVVLGAGFGGLELSTLISETLSNDVDVTLIDKSDAFVLGYSKLDLMFGHTTLDAVRLSYRNFVKPGVNFRQRGSPRSTPTRGASPPMPRPMRPTS